MTVMRCQNFIFLPVNLLVYNKFLEHMNNPFCIVLKKVWFIRQMHRWG